MTPELTERRARLHKFIREHRQPDSCRIVHPGPGCQCILCDFMAILGALDDLEQQASDVAAETTISRLEEIRRSGKEHFKTAAEAWRQAAQAYGEAIAMIDKIREAQK